MVNIITSILHRDNRFVNDYLVFSRNMLRVSLNAEETVTVFPALFFYPKAGGRRLKHWTDTVIWRWNSAARSKECMQRVNALLTLPPVWKGAPPLSTKSWSAAIRESLTATPARSTAPILHKRRCKRISGAEESEGFHGKGDGIGNLFSLKNFINRIEERNFPGYTG